MMPFYCLFVHGTGSFCLELGSDLNNKEFWKSGNFPAPLEIFETEKINFL
jgi:hypothetical protein